MSTNAAYLLTTAGVSAPPPVFDRAYICGLTVTFSGLTITTPEYGRQPWFELAYQCFADPATRASIRAQKKQAKDHHVILEYFTRAGAAIYDEPGQWLQPLRSVVGEDTPNAFRAMVLEVLADGLVPVVVYDGDNGMSPSDGAPNALRQLPILTALLKDRADAILFARFWDGVFYGATPESIQQFGQAFRRLLPLGHLAIEHNPGHIPLGNGTEDYEPGGMMADYDVIVSEFEYPDYAQDSTWQVVARMVKPYHRPPDEPPPDDPDPPFYLRTPTVRGPWFYIAFEIGEYQWVRNQVSAAELARVGAYYRAMGAPFVGLP